MENEQADESAGGGISAHMPEERMSTQPWKPQPVCDDSQDGPISSPSLGEAPEAQCPGPPGWAPPGSPEASGGSLLPKQREHEEAPDNSEHSPPSGVSSLNVSAASHSPPPLRADPHAPLPVNETSHALSLPTTCPHNNLEPKTAIQSSQSVETAVKTPPTSEAGALKPLSTTLISSSPLVSETALPNPLSPTSTLPSLSAPPSTSPSPLEPGAASPSHLPPEAASLKPLPVASLPTLLPTEVSSPTSHREPPTPSSTPGVASPSSPLIALSSSPPAAISPSLDSQESSSHLHSHPSSDLSVSEGLEELVGRERGPGQSVYHIKWLLWKEQKTPIVTQNENGPCPLLAIINVLLLAWKVKLPPMMEIITSEQLMEYLGDYILEAKPKDITEAQRLNYEQNMNDAMAILHKLQTGLDVNVKFTGIRVFEYTPECIVFDLLDIPLYHGWLVDPQSADVLSAVGNCSYNQLVEKIILCKQSEDSEQINQGLVAEQFLNSTATQLTYHGLCELTSSVAEGELCVFFRNNHFSTMTKFKDQLYLLVTDLGFLTEEKIVWESLHNVDGDGNFCDADFHLRPPSNPDAVYEGQLDQIDQDYLIALSLQQEQQNEDIDWEHIPEGISDLELAKKLQEDEDRRASQYYQEQEQVNASSQPQEGQHTPQHGSLAAGQHPGSSDRRGKDQREKEKEKNSCALL
ncbi:hypothetical protein NDU88_006928 [Pleurodeles waltl]|uniref:Ubiquitin carboxyl-terminal hydrolase n=1 Tax=Pleurodeles waltl TaxID=8319 RepID=A0AAV7TZ72_PLEWA|nr:hypothetical protein NDU88_006928 [Pleurodeles waltl]